MMIELMAEIRAVCPHIDGWCTMEKAEALAASVVVLRSQLTVEIGVYAGRSAIALALAHRFMNSGKLMAIDPWDPTHSVKGQTPEDEQYWSSPDMHQKAKMSLYRWMEATKTRALIEIVEKSSNDVTPPRDIDLLHVDGNHSEQSVTDVRRFSPYVRVGGLVFMDDIHWQNDGPERACSVLEANGFKRLYSLFNKSRGGNDDWAIYQRIAP